MPQSSRPTRAKRDNLAENDWRSPDTTVITRPQGSSNYGYAYHEPGDNGEPICGAGDPNTEFIEVTVSKAQKRNKCPCKMCDRILKK
jgi:hypothetical protein